MTQHEICEIVRRWQRDNDVDLHVDADPEFHGQQVTAMFKYRSKNTRQCWIAGVIQGEERLLLQWKREMPADRQYTQMKALYQHIIMCVRRS